MKPSFRLASSRHPEQTDLSKRVCGSPSNVPHAIPNASSLGGHHGTALTEAFLRSVRIEESANLSALKSEMKKTIFHDRFPEKLEAISQMKPNALIYGGL